MSQAPRIETARITGQFQIEIHWSTGEVFTTDLKDLKDPVGPPRDEDPFRPLHDPAFFAQVRADDWGNGLSWPGELDPGADRLYALGRKQAGLPTREDFVQWMERNHLSPSHTAEAIGMTRRMTAYYKNGSRPIPKPCGWLASVMRCLNATQLDKLINGCFCSGSGRSDSQPDWSERICETAFISSNLVAKSAIHSLLVVTVTFPRISCLWDTIPVDRSSDMAKLA